MKSLSFFFIFGAILSLPVAGNASGAPKSKTVILVSAPGDSLEMKRLRDTIAAHLSDLDARVTVKAVADMPEDIETQMDAARVLLQEETALAAVWLEHSTDTLMLLVLEENTEQVLRRSIAEHFDNPEQIYDAAAAAVRAALTPWFCAEPPQPTKKSTPPEQTTSSPRKEVLPKPRLLSLCLFGGYTLVSNPDGPLSNGAVLGAGAVLFRRVELGIDLRLLQSADMDIPDKNIRLFRLPLTLKAAVFAPTGPLILGVKTGLTFDIARVLGADERQAPEAIQRTRIGFSAALFVRYPLLDWINAELSITLDVFSEAYRYRWNKETVFTNGKIQPGGALGFSFFFSPGDKKP